MIDTPVFSVVIPTYNRPALLYSCLQALTKQKLQRSDFEIIVVDDGSTPPVRDSIPTEFPGIHLTLIRNPDNKGPAAARNRGAEIAKGKYLAFADDDCLPDPDWLVELQHHLADSPAIAVGGRFVSGGGDIFSATSHAILESVYEYYNNQQGAQFFASVNFAVPAQRYRQIGGFHPNFRTSEDREFCARWLRCGNTLAFAPDAVIVHKFAPGLRNFLRRHYFYGKGAYRFRSLEARNRGRRLMLESPAFYKRLIRPPLKEHSPLSALAISFWAAVAQAASLLGFLVERKCAIRAR
jgi:glycosyltransferase involved in cell wall biosynthesis